MKYVLFHVTILKQGSNNVSNKFDLLDLFLFIQNDFLQQIACIIISGIISIIICNWNQDNDFGKLC